MSLDTLVAKANTGAGTDGLAGKNIAGVGWAGGVLLLDENGAEINGANPLPINVAALLAAIQAYTKAEDSSHTSGDSGVPMLAIRNDSDAATANDGDYTLLKLDEEGRLKVAVKPATYAAVTGNITTNGGTVVINTSRVSNIMLQLFTASAFAGHNVAFEGSLNSTNGTDGNWFGVQAVRSNANTIETSSGALSAAPAYGWEVSVNGMNWFRVRATSHTSGTASWVLQPAPYATEPAPAAQISGTQPVSGFVSLNSSTNRLGFTAAHGIWWDDSSTVLAANASFTGTSRDLTATATATVFASAGTFAKELRVSAESDQSGTLWLEVSRDNTNWRRVKSVATAAVAGGGHFAEIIHLPSWRYVRVGFTNGATLQTRFSIGSIAMAA